MKKIIYIAFIALLFFISGCTQIMSSYVDDYEKAFDAPRDPGDSDLFNYDAMATCAEGTCVCFTCGITNSFIYDFLGIKGHSLIGQTCRFNSPCGSINPDDKYDDIEASLSETLMPFAIGMGTTFSDFSQADRYCLNKLNMPVAWLEATPGKPYPLPSSSRSMCFLDRGLMPLYILYSGGKTADNPSALAVAETLKVTGPVIITSEMDPDFEHLDQQKAEELRRNITKQLIDMKAACPNCLIALGVKMGDTETLKLLENIQVNRSVDLIAFGINTHNSKARCNPLSQDDTEAAGVLFYEASQFAKKILHDYNKSSVIAYMLFDAGLNADSSCTWDEFKVDAAYKYFFTGALLRLAGSGVIGAAPYSYLGTTDPLKQCNNCQITSLSQDGKPELNERFLNWFSFCQSYKAKAGILPTNDLIVVYPTQSGTYCPAAYQNARFYQTLAARSGEFGPDFIRPDLLEPQTEIFACDACVFDPPPDSIEDFPFKLDEKEVKDAKDGYSPSYCKDDSSDIDELIDAFADRRDLDPMLVRAVIWKESSFKPCSRSTVSFYSSVGCNNPTLPENLGIGWLDNKVQTAWSGSPNTEPSIVHAGCDIRISDSSNRRFCAYGLMQTIEFPGYIYHNYAVNREVTYPKNLEQCAAELGVPDYLNPKASEIDPFNPKHSICMGTIKLQDYIPEWNEYVNAHANELNVGGAGPEGETKRNIMGVYFALHRYFGDVRPWLEDQIPFFTRQKNLAPDACETGNPYPCEAPGTFPAGADRSKCIGNTDFINYISTCRIFGHPNYDDYENFGDYGARVLARYEQLRTRCELSTCPSYKKQQEFLSSDPNSIPAPPANPAPSGP